MNTYICYLVERMTYLLDQLAEGELFTLLHKVKMRTARQEEIDRYCILCIQLLVDSSPQRE